MKNDKNAKLRTTKNAKKVENTKKQSSNSSHSISRQYLTNLFFSEVTEQKIPLVTLIKETPISKGTFLNIKRGKLPILPTLCQLFSTPLISPILSPENACWVVNKIIAESLRCTTQYPVLTLVPMNEEHPSPILLSLPEYMKSLRTTYLNISVRKTCERFDYCSSLQIAKIEKDCLKIGIGPICNLFDNYLREIPTLSNEEWSTFATLALQHLFPTIQGYALQFVRLRNN